MMKLSLMKRFFDTVDAQWQSPIADQIAARWVDGAAVRCIRASANFAFVVDTTTDKYALRFNHADERQVSYIAGELACIEHVAAGGIHAARPIPSRNGQLIESVPTEMGMFHAVLFEAMLGDQWEALELDAAGLRAWGRAQGQLHAAVEGFHVPGRPSWGDHLAMARQNIPPHEREVLAELAFIEEKLHQFPVDPGSFGLIHYDFELDNIRWNGERASIFDFDDCAYYWFAADIAMALRVLFDDRAELVDLENAALRSFLQGYRSARTIEEEQVRQIPLLLRFHNLTSFARGYRSVEEGPLPGEPRWTTDLRDKLVRGNDVYRESTVQHPLSKLIG